MKQEKEEKESADPKGQTGAKSSSDVTGEDAKKQDAISMLKADHREIEQLFDRYKAVSRRADRAKIAKEVCNALTIHAILEEEIFYPACRELIDDQPLDEAQVEHDSAKVLIEELISGRPEDPFYDAKVNVLAEQVKQHIREEEGKPDSIFAKAEAAGADFVVIGEELKKRKAELLSKASRETLQAEPCSFKALANLTKEEDMASYQRGRDYEERGPSRSRYDEETGRRRDEQGRFMSNEDYGNRGGQERRYRVGSERDEYSRSSSDRDQGYRSRPSYEDEEYSSRGQRMPERDEYGRFVSDDERHGQSYSHGRDYENERRGSRSHGGWFGDPEGHAEAARRGWDEREGEGRAYRDENERRSSSQGSGRRYEQRSRQEEDDERHQGSGWYGDREGHSEASRRGWEHRR